MLHWKSSDLSEYILPSVILCLCKHPRGIPIHHSYFALDACSCMQSYEIKSPPWTILWFRILGIIARLGVFMFQTSDNSQLCIDSQYILFSVTDYCLKFETSKPIYIFSRVRVLHLDRLKEGT